MRFWDASALAGWAMLEEKTVALRRLLEEDGGVALWWGSRVECGSAFFRRRREGVLGEPEIAEAWHRLGQIEGDALCVQPAEAIREGAVRLLRVHGMRAGDALQLAAALAWCLERPQGRGFVCLDARLRDAAAREGFRVLPA